MRIHLNPVYKAFHQIDLCGNERIGPWQFKRDLDEANLQPALEQSCGKKTPSASILFSHTKLVCVLISKSRGESDLSLCMISVLAKRMQLRSAQRVSSL